MTPKPLPNPPDAADEMTGEQLAQWFLGDDAPTVAPAVTCKGCGGHVHERSSLEGYCIKCFGNRAADAAAQSPVEVALPHCANCGTAINDDDMATLRGHCAACFASKGLNIGPAAGAKKFPLPATPPAAPAVATATTTSPTVSGDGTGAETPATALSGAKTGGFDPPPDSRTILITRLRTINGLRGHVADQQAAIKAIKERHAAELAPLVERLRDLNGKLDEATIEAKNEAETLYWETSDKAPAPGVKIKVFTVLDYRDDAALDWCQQHNQFVVVSYDKRAFETFAKQFPDQVPFVTIDPDPRAEFAADLGRALEAAGL